MKASVFLKRGWCIGAQGHSCLCYMPSCATSVLFFLFVPFGGAFVKRHTPLLLPGHVAASARPACRHRLHRFGFLLLVVVSSVVCCVVVVVAAAAAVVDAVGVCAAGGCKRCVIHDAEADAAAITFIVLRIGDAKTAALDGNAVAVFVVIVVEMVAEDDVDGCSSVD